MSTVAERSRKAAVAAFDWIATTTVATDGPPAWAERGVVDDSLYSGAPGVLLACAEARANGLDTPGIRTAADLAVARSLHVAQSGVGAEIVDDGLFAGWAGVAVALSVWAATTGDDRGTAGAEALLAAIADRAEAGPADGNTDIISGDAGILVALLTTGTTPGSLAAAGLVADRLVAVAEDSPSGPQWRMVPDYPILMPNFSHGTAGVAYALALAGDRLTRPDLLDMAVRGAETLLAVGGTSHGWALPLTIPPSPHRPPVSFGWCHGPSGTIKVFDLLSRLQPTDPRWPTTVAQCYDAVRHSGLPERHTPGFWDNVARCCGTAGVGMMVLDRYQATGDSTVLAWADELAEDVLDRAIIDATGTRWSNHEHTVDPPDLTPEASFLQGTAGIAGWLARLAAVHDDPHAPGLDLRVTPRWV